MSRTGWIAAGILGLGLIASLTQNHNLQSQISTLNLRLDGQEAERATAQRAGEVEVATLGLHGAVHPGTPALTTAPITNRGRPSLLNVESEIEDAVEKRLEEAVEQRMEERQDEWRTRMRDNMLNTVNDFSESAELSAEESESLHGVLEIAMEDLADIWQSHHEGSEEGEHDREAMHEDMVEVRADMDEALTELLGEDDAEAFQRELRGPLSWKH